MQCAELPLNARVQWATSYTLRLQFPLNTFQFVPYNTPFVLKLSTVKALGCEFTACPTVGSSRIFYFGVFLNFPLKLLSFIFKPSMCSNKFSFIFAPNGSKTKSIPSRRASFAAGTKSLSPAMRII